MPRGKTHTPEAAERLLQAAHRVYASDGASGLTLRKVASEASTSTSAVYALFGDKDALLVALYCEGFRLLRAQLMDCPHTDDPLADMLELGLAYRRSAHQTPHLYELMFGHPLRSLRLGPHNTAVAEEAYAPMRDAVQRAADHGLLNTKDVDHVAHHLWATAHGLVSLELAGWFSETGTDAEHEYNRVLLAAGAAHLSPGHPPGGAPTAGTGRPRSI